MHWREAKLLISKIMQASLLFSRSCTIDIGGGGTHHRNRYGPLHTIPCYAAKFGMYCAFEAASIAIAGKSNYDGPAMDETRQLISKHCAQCIALQRTLD